MATPRATSASRRPVATAAARSGDASGAGGRGREGTRADARERRDEGEPRNARREGQRPPVDAEGNQQADHQGSRQGAHAVEQMEHVEAVAAACRGGVHDDAARHRVDGAAARPGETGADQEDRPGRRDGLEPHAARDQHRRRGEHDPPTDALRDQARCQGADGEHEGDDQVGQPELGIRPSEVVLQDAQQRGHEETRPPDQEEAGERREQDAAGGPAAERRGHRSTPPRSACRRGGPRLKSRAPARRAPRGRSRDPRGNGPRASGRGRPSP